MKQLVKDIISIAKKTTDFCDIRLVSTKGCNIAIQDGRADKIATPDMNGIGIRVLVGGAWGFAATNSLEKKDIEQCLNDAAQMAKTSAKGTFDKGMISEVKPIEDTFKTKYEIDPREIDISEKINKIVELEKVEREYDKRVVNTIVGYNDSWSREIIGNTFGTLIENISTRVRIGTTVVASEGNERQVGYEQKSAVAGYELVKNLNSEDLSLKAAEKAIKLLSAKQPPSGKFPVVLDSAVTGLFVHEAIGHNAEADLVWSGESILEGKVGKKVASDIVTIIDDGTIEGIHGFYKYDSEGTPAEKRIIVENGILIGFMHSLETAKKFNVSPNGSARAMDHQCKPIVRMSNTYIKEGKSFFEDLISDIKEGVFLKGGSWGYVFVERGQFTCNVEEGFMIRNGKLAEHIRNVSVSGMTLETLKNIEGLSDKVEFKLGGMCGKGGQGMFVDAGGPFVRVKELVVGGRI